MVIDRRFRELRGAFMAMGADNEKVRRSTNVKRDRLFRMWF
jgi:hypothetical protein